MGKKKPPPDAVTEFFRKKIPDEVMEFFRKQGAKGGKIGGKRSLETMTPEQRTERARKASKVAVQARAKKAKARKRAARKAAAAKKVKGDK